MPRLLLVDDSAVSREWARRVLEGEGWSVQAAGSGLAGVEMATREAYDAIVLDFVLPDMDGLDVLRDLALAGATSPCIVVSGASSPEVATRALRSGAVDFLAKDHLTPLRLAHAVRMALAHGPTHIAAVRQARALPQEEDEPMRTEPGLALVVDDTATTRALLRRILEGSGWRVIEAGTAGRALDAAVTATPDVVLLDHVLPDGEGADLVPTFAAIGVPVIALTGHGDEKLAERFMLAGAADYLTKEGLTASRLLTALARIAWVGATATENVRKRRRDS